VTITEGGTITFPPGQWIPNPDQLGDTGATLLAVARTALTQFSRNAAAYKEVLTHSQGGIAWRREQGKSGFLLIVTFDSLQLGKAGLKDYQFTDGAMGKSALVVVQYTVQVWNGWPGARGGMAPALPQVPEMTAASLDLWRDGYCVWAAVRALSLGGVTTTPPVVPLPGADKLLAGPITPRMAGGLAGLQFTVEAQI